MVRDKNWCNRWNQQSSEIGREIERKAVGRMPNLAQKRLKKSKVPA
jgi:hypothetical protein